MENDSSDALSRLGLQTAVFLSPTTEVDDSSCVGNLIRTCLNYGEMLCQRVGLGREVLHMHPYIPALCRSMNQAAGYWSSVSYTPNFPGLVGDMVPLGLPLATPQIASSKKLVKRLNCHYA